MIPAVDHPFQKSEPLPWAGLDPAGPPPRVALIGVSGYAQIYLNLIRELQERQAAELVAAVIINAAEEPAAVAELRGRGCRIYNDYRAMLAAEAGKIDLCFVPTGIPWHAPMTIEAVRAGANVLVEKPLAGSVADAAAIRAAERASGKWVAVGFQDLYPPHAHWLKRQLLAGLVGPVRSIRFIGMWPRGTGYYTRNNWAGRLAVGGVVVNDSPLSNAFGHFVNLVLYFAGETAGESARVREVSSTLLRAHAIESFDTAIVRAKSEAGIDLVTAATHVSRSVHEPEIEIVGELGRVRWLHESACHVALHDGRASSFRLPSAMDSRRHMFANVLARLRGSAAIVCDSAIAERHTAFIEAVARSGPIATVAPARIDWTPFESDSSPIPCVRGIESVLLEAFGRPGEPESAGKSVGSALEQWLQ